MNEDCIIAFLKKAFPQTIGDDAAVLPHGMDELVVSKDLFIEDVHFRRRYQTAQSLAHKALAVNLSDMAAMGATPFSVFLGLSTNNTDTTFVETFLEAFVKACQEANVILMGGDTTRAPSDQLFLSVTILGRGPSHLLKYRHTATPGDLLYVAGPIGKAHLGLTALERDMAGFDACKAHFLNPTARVAEGLWLAKQPCVHAMMDLSDGLWVDLNKLIAASHCSAMIHIESFTPTLDELQAYHLLDLPVVETQLIGGEDYSLLFSASPETNPTLTQEFEAQFGYPLLQIGEITPFNPTAAERIQVFQKNKPISLTLHPFNHFDPGY